MKSFIKTIIAISYVLIGLVEPAILNIGDTGPKRGRGSILYNIIFSVAFVSVLVWAIIKMDTLVNYLSLFQFVLVFAGLGIIFALIVLAFVKTNRQSFFIGRGSILPSIIFGILFTILLADFLNREFFQTEKEHVTTIQDKKTKSDEDIFKWLYFTGVYANEKMNVPEDKFDSVAIADTVTVKIRTGIFGFKYFSDIREVRQGANR